MAKKKDDQVDLLKMASSTLTQPGSDDDIEYPIVDVEDEDLIDPVDDDIQDPSDTTPDDDSIDIPTDDDLVDNDAIDDDQDVDDDIDNDQDTVPTDDNPVVIDDLGEYEPQVAAYLEEKLYDKFGWTLEEEDARAENVDSIVDLLQSVVDENSKPDYASDDIEKLDEFVKNGGNLRDYFTSRYSEDINLDKVDVARQSDQERILREYFKSQGYQEDKIDKRIQRYDDTGVLQDEAEDALELLKKHKDKNAEKLLAEQENARKQHEEQQQKFVDDVTLYIDNSKDILGIPLTKAQKDSLKKSMFKVDADGNTEFQKMYNKNMISGFVESALLATKRDLYNKRSGKAATSKAAQNFRKTLQSGKNNPRQKAGGADDQSVGSDLLKKLSWT